MAAERCRSAVLDGAHHFELPKADMAAITRTPCGAGAAEDVRDLKQWPGHGGRLFGLAVFRAQRREPIERAHDLADDVRRHLRITRRRFQFRMSKKHLDNAHVDVLLKQMRCKTVP